MVIIIILVIKMNTIYLNSGKYCYKITHKSKGGLSNHNETKRRYPILRRPSFVYFDKRDDIFKEIVYPVELHNTEANIDDPVESYVDSIIMYIPEWTKIEIMPLEEIK